MSFWRVVSTALKGCGTTLSRVRASDGYKKAVKEERWRQLEDPLCVHSARDAHAMAWKAMAWRTMAWRAKAWREDAGMVSQDRPGIVKIHRPLAELYNVHERAMIRCFATLLLDRTRRLALNDDLRELAAQCRKASSWQKRRALVCRGNDILRGHYEEHRYRRASDWEEYKSQAAERSLPLYYSDPFSKYYGRPNCLGMAQITAAFLDACGVKTMHCLPLLGAEDWARQLMLDQITAFESIVAGFRADGVDLKKAVQFIRDLKSSLSTEELPLPWSHHAVAADLGAENWFIIDPLFFGVAAAKPNGWSLEPVYKQVLGSELHLPGLALQRSAKGIERRLGVRQVAGLIRELRATLKRMCPEGRLSSDPAVAYRAYLGSQATAKIRRYTTGQSYGEIVERELSRATFFLLVDVDNIPEPDADRLIERYVCSDLYRRRCERPVEETLQELSAKADVSQLSYQWMMQCVINAIGELIQRHKSCADLPDSKYEFGNTKYQLAVHTLSHIAVLTGKNDEVAETLLQHACSAGRVHNQLSALARCGKEQVAANPFIGILAETVAATGVGFRDTPNLLSSLPCKGT